MSSDIHLSPHYQRKITVQEEKLFSSRLVLCSNLTGKIPFVLWAVLAAISCMVSLKTCQTHSQVHSINFTWMLFLCYSSLPPMLQIYIGKISRNEYLESRNYLRCNLSTSESFRNFWSRSFEVQLIMLKSSNSILHVCAGQCALEEQSLCLRKQLSSADGNVSDQDCNKTFY